METYLRDLDEFQSRIAGQPCEEAMSIGMIILCLGIVEDNWRYAASSAGHNGGMHPHCENIRYSLTYRKKRRLLQSRLTPMYQPIGNR